MNVNGNGAFSCFIFGAGYDILSVIVCTKTAAYTFLQEETDMRDGFIRTAAATPKIKVADPFITERPSAGS